MQPQLSYVHTLTDIFRVDAAGTSSSNDWYDQCYAEVCLDAWSGHLLHQDDVPDSINAVTMA